MFAPSRIPPREPGAGDRFRVAVPSDISRVGEIVDAVCDCCFAGTLPTTRTRFRLCTVVAEAVANAMLYGNASDPARLVTVEIELQVDALLIGVSDEGAGFDHHGAPRRVDDDTIGSTRGRGLFMIHKLADRVDFNEQGNTIWMTLPRR